MEANLPKIRKAFWAESERAAACFEPVLALQATVILVEFRKSSLQLLSNIFSSLQLLAYKYVTKQKTFNRTSFVKGAEMASVLSHNRPSFPKQEVYSAGKSG